MRRVLLSNVELGAILGRSITSADGTLLLGAGAKLTPRYVNRLQDLGVAAVYIWDERTADLEIQEPISDQTRLLAANAIREVMAELKDEFEHDRILAHNLPQLTSAVDEIINDLLSSGKLFMDFFEIKTIDDYTFLHSVNVCVLALILGLHLGYHEGKLRELGLGALLHDIGKTFIPTEIITKPGPLTEAEWKTMTQHTTLGFDILRESQEMSLSAAHISYQHHERYDGTGYPRGLAGDDIHPYARLTAICDVFDALTSNRNYRRPYLPHEALEYILGNGNSHFDYQLVSEFTKCVAMYPLGSEVRLSNGTVGIVIEVPPQVPQRPVVRIIRDEKGRDLDSPYDLSLLDLPHIVISAVLNS